MSYLKTFIQQKFGKSTSSPNLARLRLNLQKNAFQQPDYGEDEEDAPFPQTDQALRAQANETTSFIDNMVYAFLDENFCLPRTKDQFKRYVIPFGSAQDQLWFNERNRIGIIPWTNSNNSYAISQPGFYYYDINLCFRVHHIPYTYSGPSKYDKRKSLFSSYRYYYDSISPASSTTSLSSSKSSSLSSSSESSSSSSSRSKRSKSSNDLYLLHSGTRNTFYSDNDDDDKKDGGDDPHYSFMPIRRSISGTSSSSSHSLVDGNNNRRNIGDSITPLSSPSLSPFRQKSSIVDRHRTMPKSIRRDDIDQYNKNSNNTITNTPNHRDGGENVDDNTPVRIQVASDKRDKRRKHKFPVMQLGHRNQLLLQQHDKQFVSAPRTILGSYNPRNDRLYAKEKKKKKKKKLRKRREKELSRYVSRSYYEESKPDNSGATILKPFTGIEYIRSKPYSNQKPYKIPKSMRKKKKKEKKEEEEKKKEEKKKKREKQHWYDSDCDYINNDGGDGSGDDYENKHSEETMIFSRFDEALKQLYIDPERYDKPIEIKIALEHVDEEGNIINLLKQKTIDLNDPKTEYDTLQHCVTSIFNFTYCFKAVKANVSYDEYYKMRKHDLTPQEEREMYKEEKQTHLTTKRKARSIQSDEGAMMDRMKLIVGGSVRMTVTLPHINTSDDLWHRIGDIEILAYHSDNEPCDDEKRHNKSGKKKKKKKDNNHSSQQRRGSVATTFLGRRIDLL